MPDIRTRSIAAAALLLLSACGDALTTDAEKPGNPAMGDDGAAAYNAMAAVSRLNGDPQRLLGMSADSVLQALGDPTLVRRDGAAEVWQYRAEACVLDLFLYGERKQVEHVDLRDRGGGSADAVQACFEEMLEAAPENAP